jgi:hypothetical protein
MRKVFGVLAFGLILFFSSTAQAASNPTIAGQTAGLELCPQFICGVAVFAGAFQGQVGFFPNAKGIVWTALNHGELPTDVGAFTPIFFGGVWELKTLFRRFGGVVTGGQITYIGNNMFQVTVNLTLTTGGSGNLTADVILDHNTLIPTFGGTLQ